MTPTRPDVADTGRYSIGQTCTALAIHRNTLREYTKRGYIVSGIRRTGSRFYSGHEIIRFWMASK